MPRQIIINSTPQEARVATMENARLLDDTIPHELYAAVAEVIGFVLRAQRNSPFRSR